MFIRQKITVDERNELLARTLSEIEERKRAQEDLQSATRAAEAATKAKSEFLVNMSHEIRTPMNAVIGVTSLLLDENLTPKQREHVEIIHDSSELLLIIINDILDLTKIESGKMQLDCRPFHLRNCVKEAMNLVATKASEKGLKLNCTIDDNIPEVILGDPLRLSQVLLNLLSNAVKFTEKGEVKYRSPAGIREAAATRFAFRSKIQELASLKEG